MKIHISLSLDDVERLKAAHEFFGCDTDEVLSGSDLVNWAVRMVVAAHEHEAQ